MIGLLILMVTLVPMMAFLAAAVVLVLNGHPYFAFASMIFSILTLPELHLATHGNNKEKNKDETTDPGD
jgi:hypothetical protein